MLTRLVQPVRTGLVVAAGVAMFVAAAPATSVAAPATSVAAPATSVAAADADLRIIGGDATSAVVCGNVAAAVDLARQRGIALQKSRCTARTAGGSTTLENVDIYVSGAALALNRDNPVLTALATDTAPGVATDNCDNHRPAPGPGKQLNKCWTVARGGKVKLNNVTLVDRRADGRTVTRVIQDGAVPPGSGGSAAAACVNVVNDPLNQRDDCTGSSAGGAWSMEGVDVVIHNPDGSTSTRRGIKVVVSGGAANASTYCFNVTDGSGRVIQINICDADAQGGEVTLHNVTFHTS